MGGGGDYSSRFRHGGLFLGGVGGCQYGGWVGGRGGGGATSSKEEKETASTAAA